MQLDEKECTLIYLMNSELKTQLVHLLIEEPFGKISDAQKIPEELVYNGCVIIFPDINGVAFPKLTRLGRCIALHFIDPEEKSPLYNHLQVVYTKEKLRVGV